MKKKNRHWTESSPEDFKYRVAFDFMSDLEVLLDDHKISIRWLATKSGLSEEAIRSIFRNPGKLTLIQSVNLSRAVGNKIALVLYADGDTKNQNGPVHPDVFRNCWQYLNCPQNLFEFVEKIDKE